MAAAAAGKQEKNESIRSRSNCYGGCNGLLLISITLNILFAINHLLRPEQHKQQLTWSEKAAAQAEEVAAISCSGHRRAYVDGLISDGGEATPVCECNDCYSGTHCSHLSPQCSADADSGDPMFLEPFWIDHAAESAVVISGWHRMSYQYPDYTAMSEELEKYIRKMHSVVGNAITENRYLVFGVGSSQLLNAAVYALSSSSSSPSKVLATAPYYPMYKTQTMFFNSESFQFQGDTNSWNSTSTNNMDVVEFVTSPNNPDGELTKPVVAGGKSIYDHAYFWPHFTPIPGPSDHDLMIFTLSKFTGHAGTRFGWAIIKDKDVYEKVLNYVSVSDLGISRDTQLRVLKVLKVAVEGYGKPFFEFAYNKMRDRWDKLIHVFSNSTRFSIQQRHPMHCNFFNQTRLPSPAYAWVKCEWEQDNDCDAVLKAGKIIGRSGSKFSATDRYTRLSLIKSQDDFDMLLQRLTELVALENSSILLHQTT